MDALQEELFSWSERYCVGIEFADVQHKQLVDIINRLHQALADGKGRVVGGRTLNDLIRYTKAHFAAEEKILENCGYTDFLAHHSEHERLAFAVLEFYQKLMSNEISMTAPTLHFLNDWLGAEILDVDMKFAPFLKGNGVP